MLLCQLFSKQIINICNKDNIFASDSSIRYETAYQTSNKSVKKCHTTHIVEFLILLWLSQVTSHQEKEFMGFKNRTVHLTEIKPQETEGNRFLQLLTSMKTTEQSEKVITEASIRLPNSIKNPEFCQFTKPCDYDNGMVLLAGRYFDIEIRYERIKNTSHSTCLMPTGFLPGSRDPGLIKSLLFNEMNIDKPQNIRIVTYNLEFYTSHKWRACLRCFFKSIRRELSWLSKTTETFKEFDINSYVRNLEKTMTLRNDFERMISPEIYPSSFLRTDQSDT